MVNGVLVYNGITMESFTAKEFFDLTVFAHASLFDESKPVWNVLKRIAPYLSQYKLGVIEGCVEEGAILINPELISIGADSKVEAGVYIKGPCIIGRHCEVRHGAYIRGNCITGNKCVIGHATEVKNAIFLDGAQAGHFAYVGDSVLGNRVNLGAGTKCANLRLDHQNVTIHAGGHRLDSGLRKMGAILGDDVQLGCNAVTNPGVLMGKKSRSYPCMVVNGVIPEGATVRQSEPTLISL